MVDLQQKEHKRYLNLSEVYMKVYIKTNNWHPHPLPYTLKKWQFIDKLSILHEVFMTALWNTNTRRM